LTAIRLSDRTGELAVSLRTTELNSLSGLEAGVTLGRREEGASRLLLSLRPSLVDPVYTDVIGASNSKAGKDIVAITAKELFPRINPAITSINVASALIDQEESDMARTVFASSCKDCVVLAEFDDVVKFEYSIVNLDHSTPPFTFIVVPRAFRGVRSREVTALQRPLNTTIAATKGPATVALVSGLVNKV
jgi:hypothetical protein